MAKVQFDRSDVRHIALRFKLRQFDLKVRLQVCRQDQDSVDESKQVEVAGEERMTAIIAGRLDNRAVG